MNYLVIDATGTVVNVVVWDGDLSTWQPPAGCTTQLVTDETIADFSVGEKVSQ